MDEDDAKQLGDREASTAIATLNAALASRYRISRLLGAGGMATVYLAEDLKHRRQVAIKVLRPEITALVGTARFLREIEIAANLTHPHILPLHDSGEAAGLLYYVMPYAQGESLRSRLTREHQLSLDEALRLARELADALSYAHSRGIVHRDLKPENVLLESGHAVLTDFGIAMAVTAAGDQRLTATGLTIGTPAYMSPEQALGDARVDARTDIYALGCILYEMLAGEPAFSGPDPQAVLARKSLGAPLTLSIVRDSLPDRVLRAIDRALARVPADRFASATDFIAALGSDDAPAVRPAPQPARRRIAWAAAAAAVLVAAAIATFTILKWLSTPAPATAGSLAVLYFDNLSLDTTDAYLADGLTEEISSRLARVERLQVKSRHAVRQYRGSEISDLAAVGKTLGVNYLVDGSVRRAGDRVRASVYLVDARTGFQVWANDYDHAASDILSLQADVAHKVAAQIAGELLPNEAAVLAARPTDNAEAYDRFLRGNYYLTQRSPSTVALAISEYERALRLDPNFTEALARAAYGYALYLEWGWTYPDLPADTLLARGIAAVQRALAQDSTSADAWMAHGYMLLNQHPHTLNGVRSAFERAIALDSTNAEAWHQYGSLLSYVGDDAGAIAAYRTALTIEPRRPGTFLLISATQYQIRNLAAAVSAADSAIALDPLMDPAYAIRALAKSQLGDHAGALDDAQAARRVSETPLFAEATLAVVEAGRGDSASARDRVNPLAAASLRSRTITVEEAIFLGIALTAVGEHSRAIDVLERAEPRGAHLFVDMRFPNFDPLRADPRFQRVAAEARPPGYNSEEAARGETPN